MEVLTVEDYSPVIAYDVIVSLGGIMGNTAAAIFYGRNIRNIRGNASPLLVTARSINDLITSLCFIDVFIILTTKGIFRNGLGCKWFAVLIKTALVNSLLILLLIGFDRYYRVCKPNSKWNITLKKAKYCLIGLPILAFIYSSPNFAVFDVVQRNATIGVNNTIVVNYCVATAKVGGDEGFAASQIQDGVSLTAMVIILIVQYVLILRRVVEQRELTRTKTLKAANPSSDENNKINTSTSGDDNTMETETAKLNSDVKSDENEIPMEDVTKKMETEAAKLNSDVKSDENEIPMEDVTKKNHSDKDVMKSSAETKTGKSKKKNKKKPTRTDRNITLTMFLMTFISLLSFVPHIIVTAVFGDKMKSVEVQLVFRSFMLHNSISPYIIGCINRDFRRFVWQGITGRCHCKCK